MPAKIGQPDGRDRFRRKKTSGAIAASRLREQHPQKRWRQVSPDAQQAIIQTVIKSSDGGLKSSLAGLYFTVRCERRQERGDEGFILYVHLLEGEMVDERFSVFVNPRWIKEKFGAIDSRFIPEAVPQVMTVGAIA